MSKRTIGTKGLTTAERMVQALEENALQIDELEKQMARDMPRLRRRPAMKPAVSSPMNSSDQKACATRKEVLNGG